MAIVTFNRCDYDQRIAPVARHLALFTRSRGHGSVRQITYRMSRELFGEMHVFRVLTVSYRRFVLVLYAMEDTMYPIVRFWAPHCRHGYADQGLCNGRASVCPYVSK